MNQTSSSYQNNKRPRCFSVCKKPESVKYAIESISVSIPENVSHDSSSGSVILTKSYQLPSHIIRLIQEGRQTSLPDTDASSDFNSQTPDSLVITPTKLRPNRPPYTGIYKSFNKLSTLDQLSTEESFFSNLYYNDSTSRDIQPTELAELSSKEYSPESVISQYNTPQRRYHSVIMQEIDQYISPDKTQFSQMIDISLGDSFISERNISPILSHSNQESFASVKEQRTYDLLSSRNLKGNQETELCNVITEEKDLPSLGSM